MRLLFILLLLLGQPLWAQSAFSDGAREALAQGVAQFQQGNLGQARESFQLAAELGVQSPSLHYNLGVVCYRLEDYSAARQWFSHLLDSDDRALAAYNLGLVALADDRPGEARGWFEESLAASPPETVQRLAEQQVAQLDGLALPRAGRRIDAYGYLSLGVGYDSNLSATPEDSASNQGSALGEVIAAGSVDYAMDAVRWLSLDLIAFARRYAEDGDYNQQLLQARFGVMRAWGRWAVGVRPVVSRSWLDGESLETRWGAELLARSAECLPSEDLRCDLAFALEEVEGGGGYQAYDGQWYQLTAGLGYPFGDLDLTGKYRLELNNRQDLNLPERFISVSPTRHQLLLEANYHLSPRLALAGELSVRHNRYGKPHRWVESGTLVERRREDILTGVGLMAEYVLTGRWLLRPQWFFRHQQSELNEYDYRRHTLLLSLEGIF
ncbi:tetratricopeptide repeat protein [Marinobacter sp. VGCF2001]|uniref:tetratricopeptide repeat protein n=1 Tax=Marinobacter sp. VGCF2001 TaxID=3417189 RepID=UPI003CEC2804